MKSRVSILVFAFFLMVYAFVSTPIVWADKLTFKDGTQIEAVVQKVDKGEITAQVGDETKVFNILDIAGIEFDTPRASDMTGRRPGEDFVTSLETSDRAAAELRKLIEETKQKWNDRRSIDSTDVPKWAAAKERFLGPLSDYQDALNDLYLQVLSRVGEYNQLMQEADQLYVGVRGILNVGSSLVPKDKEKLPLKKYVPGNWYDTIFYDGYNLGYNDGHALCRPGD